MLDESYGYGSIPINTIFSGMNIHLPAILMFTRGTSFWHTAICPNLQRARPGAKDYERPTWGALHELGLCVPMYDEYIKIHRPLWLVWKNQHVLPNDSSRWTARANQEKPMKNWKWDMVRQLDVLSSNQTWLGNPQTKWRYTAGQSSKYFCGYFQPVLCLRAPWSAWNFQQVYPVYLHSIPHYTTRFLLVKFPLVTVGYITHMTSITSISCTYVYINTIIYI
jgi:hypothetical protein